MYTQPGMQPDHIKHSDLHRGIALARFRCRTYGNCLLISAKDRTFHSLSHLYAISMAAISQVIWMMDVTETFDPARVIDSR